ncbi:MAG: 30S ribosome-binding factor RbfA [candidate division Zixibacteria bacterium]|nr:30S ribosome-binding factor RbfA [candidate division Zixibacteria bacterium]
MRDFKRTDRLSSQIGKELSNLLIDTLPPPADVLISITEVSLTKDLRIAKVYYSVYGDNNAIDRAENYFKDNIKRIRMELAGRIRVRFMPELTFNYDPSIEREQRISELLNRIKKDEK